MVNQIGGKNYKKGKKGGRKTKNPTNQFDTTAGQYLYGQVISKLGHNRLSVKLQTGIEIQAVIPGRFMKKVWFNKEDYIVVQCNDNKFYDVVQKVTSNHILSKATVEMREKADTDNKDLYNPFNDKQDSDDEDLAIDEYGNTLLSEVNKGINVDKQTNQDENDDIDSDSEENDNSDNDDEDLVVNNNSNLPLSNSEDDSDDSDDLNTQTVNNSNSKVSNNYLLKKQQNKLRDIDKRNRRRVFTNFNKQDSEEKSEEDLNNTETNKIEDNRDNREEKPINKTKKKNKIDITKLIFNNQQNNQINNKPITKQSVANKTKNNYIMTDAEKNKEILDLMS